MRKRKIIIASFVVMLIGAISITLGMKTRDEIGLVIGEEEVLKEEFLDAMNSEKHAVIQYFHQKHGATVNEHFWSNNFDDEIPYQLLVDRAIVALTKTHAVYEIAKEKGNIASASYTNLLDRFELENKTREEKISKGEAVYGLAKFTLELYKEYEMSALEKIYMNDMDNEGMSISEEESKRYYEENKERMFVKNDDLEIEYIKVYYGISDMEEKEVAVLKEALEKVSEELHNGATIESIISQHETLAPFYEHLKISSAEFSAWGREIGDVLELAMGLESGEISSVIDQNNSLYLIHCMDRVRNDYVPYEEVEGNILKILHEKSYEELVFAKAKELPVQSDLDKLYVISKKHVE